MAGTTLAQGASATLTLAATDSVLIDSDATGSAVIEAVSGVQGSANAARLVNHPGGQASYGPFGAGTVKLSAVGASIRYMQGGAPLTDEGGFASYATDASGNVLGLVLPTGVTIKIPRLIVEKTAITDGAIQIADQVIGSLSIPAGSLNVGDCFRALVTFGRDNNTDAYGATTSSRMGTAGTVADSLAGQINMSGVLPAASGGLSAGLEAWWRVVSIGTNSVIENLGIANGGPSWAAASASGLAVGTQRTLTGYNLTTQAGFFTFTTTMATAVSTMPRTGYMRLEVQV